MEVLPLFSEDLVKELEDLYPEFVPAPTDDLSVIMFRAGQRSIVKQLMFLLKRTQEESLSKELKGGT